MTSSFHRVRDPETQVTFARTRNDIDEVLISLKYLVLILIRMLTKYLY